MIARDKDVLDRRQDQRRLPVGDFLFGALFLNAPSPIALHELGETAAGCGLNIAQVLTWVERAEAGGIVERVGRFDRDAEGARGLRLTHAGIDVARTNRRSAQRRAMQDETRSWAQVPLPLGPVPAS